MSELCREVFEKRQAKLLNMDYQELKEQFDRHEKCFSKRYATFSDFEKEFELWQAAWNVRQTEIDQLKAELALCREENKGLVAKVSEQQKRVDEISTYATELAEYASYAEIVGAVSQNRSVIREYCDKIFAYNRAIDLEEENALRGEHESS